MSSHLRSAREALEIDPFDAIQKAHAAIAGMDLESPALPGAVLVLAEAYERAGMDADIVELAKSCEGRFPDFVELRFRAARAHGRLGQAKEMFAEYQRCLAIGEKGSYPCTVGASSFLVHFELGLFAEAHGDATSARSFFERALPYEPAADRLRAQKPARPLTIVACIPGNQFSGRFFDAWNDFAEKCRAVGVNLILSRRYDAVVYYARNKVAGGDARKGPLQAPWGGAIDYDYMLWIDSDVIFRFEDLQTLLKHDVDLVAGLYLMADNARFCAVETMDAAHYQKFGSFEFLTPAVTAKRQGLIPVDYCGFGFVLVKKGVFEKIAYPWFRPIYIEMGETQEFTAEDVGFCLMAKKAGFQMFVDPRVTVGHEKSVVLTPPAAPPVVTKAVRAA